eukprot:gnl/TRDRNA2_/TRDRNA2_192424_c0_seq1.p2 gnl/TRDRNA2_/TRDRNA2_192424_c0~~gnl/TRDRNA2_/TRDRNA2_192424_c0_seq1.p2  ORF type:complete len:121 (+),score=0.62 gnl/TRDRNA2_/TRDRNA2_192424_c0_seq1:15-377(+)
MAYIGFLSWSGTAGQLVLCPNKSKLLSGRTSRQQATFDYVYFEHETAHLQGVQGHHLTHATSLGPPAGVLKSRAKPQKTMQPTGSQTRCNYSCSLNRKAVITGRGSGTHALRTFPPIRQP